MAQVLTDLHQIMMYPFLLNNNELQEVNGIRDKALATRAVNSTHQFLNAVLDNEGVKVHAGKRPTSTVTERQLVLKSFGAAMSHDEQTLGHAIRRTSRTRRHRRTRRTLRKQPKVGRTSQPIMTRRHKRTRKTKRQNNKKGQEGKKGKG